MDLIIMNLFEIPIRKIQKYVFCPRQFELEVLLQIPPDNTVELLKGELIHNRIDRKQFRNRKRKLFGISVELSHEELGIMGIIDLVELSPDGKLIPVEFKKNSDPSYLPDWISLAAYALCLERDGYEISHLEIYSHDSRKRYRRAYDTNLRQLTISTIHQIRQETEFPRTPNRNKCTRCANRTFCWSETIPTEIKLE